MSAPNLVLVMAPALTRELLGPEQQARLQSCCHVPDPEPITRFDDSRGQALLADAEILFTSWGCPPIDAAVLDRAPALRAVMHAAGTVKHHVSGVCYDRGIRICSAAAANALPVAEYTLGVILLSNKRVFRLQQQYREQRSFRLWSQEHPGLGNHRKVIGIVGASRIGRRVIELLEPFDFDRLVHDPYLGADEARRLGVELVALDDLLKRSDLVTLHAPALPETRHLLDRRRLALLQDGAVLVNTARGALVDGDALQDELVSGRIDAVIDTTEPEILPADSPLYDLPNVLLTPHIAGALGPETRRMADLVIDEIERLIRGEALQHEVRREDLARIA